MGGIIGPIKGDTRSLAPGAPSARARPVRVPRASADQSIHAPTIIPFIC